MTEYEVQIPERVIHVLRVEAASHDEAIELAAQLLSNGMSDDMKKDVDYQFNYDGFTGEDSAEEL